MQLRIARLCLDCEELHDAQQCPVCASEIFAYLSRWVPAPERRAKPRLRSERRALTPRNVAAGVGVLGAVAYAWSRWSDAARKRLEAATSRQATGELR